MPDPQIVQSSPQAASAEPLKVKTGLNLKPYPFDDLRVGTSFTIPQDECNLKSLRQVTARRNTANPEKEFVIVVHAEAKLVEVARRR